MFRFNILRLLPALLALLMYSLSANSQQITAEQIERFKSLPPAQQRMLAESMGINFSDIEAFIGSSASSPENVQSLKEQISGARTRNGVNNSNSGVNGSINGVDNLPNGIGANNFNVNSTNNLEQSLTNGTDIISLEENASLHLMGEQLQLFGYDIFNLGAQNFTPASDIPVPANYVLGPGDTLVIQLYGKENTTHSLELNREGAIQFPNIGPVILAGLSFKQARQKINEIVNQQMIGVKCSTTMGALRTIRIFVLGDAQIPGSYVVGSLSTMTNALFASGGITKIGSLRNIQLKRRGEIVTTLDLYDLLLKGDTSKDSRLLPGDVIFIPTIGKTVGLSGEVKRPAIYEIKTETTVEDVLNLAGGLLPTAYLPASRIERITDAGEKTLVNLDISLESGKKYPLHDADVIQVFSTLETFREVVKLEGHVKRPNGFAWRPGMRFTDIVPNVDDLLPNPDIDIALIKREEKLTRQINVLLFSPKAAFANPQSPDNIKLSSRDTVVLFDYETDRTEILMDILKELKVQANFNVRERTVEIYGSVRFEGEYPLTEGMSAHDLIALAGGLTESALGTKGEITRYEIDSQRQTLVMHLDVNLSEENPSLIESDTLRVTQIPLWQRKESITLDGEILHPGTYTILPGETLMDVLYRAGGLTPHAYPEGAVFSREDLRQLEAERLEDLKSQIEAEIVADTIQGSLAANKAVTADETEKVLDNINRVQALGRMVIDLPAIMENPTVFDFQLEDGDVLEIPRYKPSVTVVGEVQYPTSHFFDQKLSLSDYVDRSGGTKNNADKRRIYIVKSNGRVMLPEESAWFRLKNKSIDPGDTIVVPLDTDRVDAISKWSSVTTIMYQAALGIAALSSL